MITDGSLATSNKIEIKLGGNAGYRCQSFVEDKFRFRVGVRPEPEDALGSWLTWTKALASGSWATRLRPSKPLFPHINSSGTGGSVCLIIQDAYGNPATLGEPLPLRVLLDDTRWLRDVIATESLMEIEDLELPRDGKWHRVTIATPDGRLAKRTNPFGPPLVPGYHLFFGDLHNQSGLCDGTGTPEYLLSVCQKRRRPGFRVHHQSRQRDHPWPTGRS